MKRVWWVFLVSGVLMTPLAPAGPISNQSNVTPGNAVAAACAGSQAFGGGLSPGNIYCANLATTYVNYGLDEQPFAQNAFNAASNSIPGVYSNNSWAEASQGILHLYSSSSETASEGFVGTVADAGWNDTVTIAGGTGTGVWNVQMLVEGELTAPGSYASYAQLDVAAFQGNTWLGQTPGFYAANDGYCKQYGSANCQWYGATEYSAIGYQSVVFTAYNANTAFNTYTAPTTVQDLLINQLVTFQMPFTYGVPFEFGIWADSIAGVTSSGVYPTSSTANIGNTILWDGSSVDGNSNFSATGLNGFNYSSAIVPEPGSFGLAALFLGVATLTRKRLGSRR